MTLGYNKTKSPRKLKKFSWAFGFKFIGE